MITRRPRQIRMLVVERLRTKMRFTKDNGNLRWPYGMLVCPFFVLYIVLIAMFMMLVVIGSAFAGKMHLKVKGE
jgi:hypothetical protein